MTAHGGLLTLFIGADVSILVFVLLRVRQTWNKTLFVAMAMSFVVYGAAIAGEAEGVDNPLVAAIALWAFVLAHPLIAIAALAAFHGEDLPRRRPAILLLLLPVPVVASFAVAEDMTTGQAYTDPALSSFFAVCFAVGLAEALYVRMSSPVLASEATWIGVGIVLLILAGPLMTVELDALGLPSAGSLILGTPPALAAFALAFARTDPFAVTDGVKRGEAWSEPSIVERGVAFVFDEARPKNLMITARREADRGRPVLILRRKGRYSDPGDGRTCLSEIRPSAHAAAMALATVRGFLSRSPGGLLALPDLAGIATLCGWPKTLDLVRQIVRISRRTDTTLLISTSLLQEDERRGLNGLRLAWWILPDPAVEVDVMLRTAFGAAGSSIFDGFLKANALTRGSFNAHHVLALTTHLGTAMDAFASFGAELHLADGLRQLVAEASEALQAYSRRSALDLSQADWPSRDPESADEAMLVTAMDHWRGKEPEPAVRGDRATDPGHSLYKRTLAIFVRELGPTGEGLLRFELRRLGRGDSELRPSDLKRLADRVDVALETMVEIVDVPEARRRLQEKLGAIRRQMGLIEEEGV